MRHLYLFRALFAFDEEILFIANREYTHIKRKKREMQNIWKTKKSEVR